MPRNSTSVSTKQERIAELAKQSPQMAFTSLAYLLDIDWLKEAYRRTRKDGAAGVDGVTAEEYEQNLEENLQRLLNRVKSGTYRAPPVRRVHIPKGGSSAETDDRGEPVAAPGTFDCHNLDRSPAVARTAQDRPPAPCPAAASNVNFEGFYTPRGLVGRCARRPRIHQEAPCPNAPISREFC
jgi:hypothetical protein